MGRPPKSSGGVASSPSAGRRKQTTLNFFVKPKQKIAAAVSPDAPDSESATVTPVIPTTPISDLKPKLRLESVIKTTIKKKKTPVKKKKPAKIRTPTKNAGDDDAPPINSSLRKDVTSSESEPEETVVAPKRRHVLQRKRTKSRSPVPPAVKKKVKVVVPVISEDDHEVQEDEPMNISKETTSDSKEPQDEVNDEKEKPEMTEEDEEEAFLAALQQQEEDTEKDSDGDYIDEKEEKTDEDLPEDLVPDGSDEEQEPETEIPAKKPAVSSGAAVQKSPAKKGAWSFLDGRGTPLAKKRRTVGSPAPRSSATAPSVSHLPPITHPQSMFDDMVRGVTGRGTGLADITALHKKLDGRALRVATMCSGTESPVLALDMIGRAIQDVLGKEIRLDHLFSCEIEPFKQAYIERNFRPPLLFRDIRELGEEKATTAYGALVDVPGGVDILITGTSCVDFSNLNNSKKEIKGQGESGQTFRGMQRWIQKNKPPIIVYENVSGAPWDDIVKMFERDLGYHATFQRVDTKKYYIPHTRQRGYLMAVRNDRGVGGGVLGRWKARVREMERPASAALDAFMFRHDDPRVLAGKSRMITEKCRGDGEGRAGRTDWVKCEAGHQRVRANEELGSKRPFTGWSDDGNTALPGFCWNEYINAEVHRVHDLMDINTLRMAATGVDPAFKTMVWNLSQNADRDTMGKLGLCQCLTPTGLPYVTSRGGPLVGEELLLLQGIPADDLILTRETERDLKDLAGNAMSTTVVGAAVLSALLECYSAIRTEGEPNYPKGEHHVAALVPRPIDKDTEGVAIERKHAKYLSSCLELGPLSSEPISALLSDARNSVRLCLSEGPTDFGTDIVECTLCGHTSSVACATPSRKYEEHEFAAFTRTRVDPGDYRCRLLEALPMIVHLKNLSVDETNAPDGISARHWQKWCAAVNASLESNEFRYRSLARADVWTASYRTPIGNSRLELRLGGTVAQWFLFVDVPEDGGEALGNALKHPVARMVLGKNAKSLTTGSNWEVCLPTTRSFQIHITGQGSLVDTYQAKLGLVGKWENTKRHSQLSIEVEGGDGDEPPDIAGNYTALGKCGTACSSLHKRDGDESTPLWFFLESGRCTMAKDDQFIFSTSKHRTSYGDYREAIATVHVDYRPDGKEGKQSYALSVHGTWVTRKNALLVSLASQYPSTISTPASSIDVTVSHAECWRSVPEIVSIKVPISIHEKIWKQVDAVGDSWCEVNLTKSKSIFESLAYFVSRVRVPPTVSDWLPVAASDGTALEAGGVCAPSPPSVVWRPATERGRLVYTPQEDVQEAGRYEHALKARPVPIKVQLRQTAESGELRVGCNAVSLVYRAQGNLSKSSFASVCMQAHGKKDGRDTGFEWRIVEHENMKISPAQFPPLTFTSNREDEEAMQPPSFKKYPLRKEQLRSLRWMLRQEATDSPFVEEEVSEVLVPALGWRAEGRVKRPVLVRGGIVADEVGYGKTAITLGLISYSKDINGPPPGPPKAMEKFFVATKASLVVVPSHLMGQWPNEIKKFTGNSLNVKVINNMSSFNSLTVGDVVDADIILVNFTVLSGDDNKYYRRLARLSGKDPDSFPSKNNVRYFRHVYNMCLEGLMDRVPGLNEGSKKAYAGVEEDARANLKVERDALENGTGITKDKKKSVYKKKSEEDAKNVTKKKKDVASVKKSEIESDPWGLNTRKVNDDIMNMKCPPLEMFYWNRVVVDEFTYINDDAKRAKVLTLVKFLKSSYRWMLSGTPAHSDFNDVQFLSSLLGMHLGIDDQVPGTKAARNSSKSQVEKFSDMLEVRSVQWHARRHSIGQAFLNRFVRQNVAEIDEIAYEEHVMPVLLPPADMAIYRELETFLKSLDMNKGRATLSKKASTGHRHARIQAALEDSASAEEALLKSCSHFDLVGGSASATEACDKIVRQREEERNGCVAELREQIEVAMRRKIQILTKDPKWDGLVKSEKGDVEDRFHMFKHDVMNGCSVQTGDDEVNGLIKKIFEEAEIAVQLNDEMSDDKGEDAGSAKKSNKKVTDASSEKEKLYDMKWALREHVHELRSLGKELCGRIRSLRYINAVREFQVSNGTSRFCITKGCKDKSQPQGVLSSCGHVGYLKCLKYHADREECVNPNCKAPVKITNIVTAESLGTDNKNEGIGEYGAKFFHIIQKVKSLIKEDRVIVFVQFSSLKKKVAEVLEKNGVKTLQVRGTVQQQIKALDIMQKEVPDRSDPRTLILTMDDESSAGVNLTTCNHAIFVHPLLAETKQLYDAYETQAVGRIRRYGQMKTVHVWRYLAKDTIDTEIYKDRTGKDAF